ncbi:hypothetical protein NBM05_13410 [Rothia sp. AR01]|uniref:Type II secretion system protein GspF domain-containing protein n=1 Tax=Rothia santali TaxID=2949643 RepID=A0A9X2HGL3_9MICC|nr:hypothetical protein [Rothia santali]MCP3426979.1 hypothetical protein [Rothia santali]
MTIGLLIVVTGAAALALAARSDRGTRAARGLTGADDRLRAGRGLDLRAAAGRLVGTGARTRDALDLWPAAVHRMVALLEAGGDPVTVWRALGAWAAEADQRVPGSPWDTAPGRDLRRMVDAGVLAARAGQGTADALSGVPLKHPGSVEARNILAGSWRVSGITGAPLAEVLTRVARGIEDALDAADAREAAVAGPRSTGRLLAALPLLGLILGTLMGTDPVGTLLGTGWGRVALLVGLALSGAGMLWSRSLICAAEGRGG